MHVRLLVPGSSRAHALYCADTIHVHRMLSFMTFSAIIMALHLIRHRCKSVIVRADAGD